MKTLENQDPSIYLETSFFYVYNFFQKMFQADKIGAELEYIF